MFFLPHCFKTTDYQTLLEQKAQSRRIVCEQIRAERYFFSSTRHVWSGTLRDMADNKGNDVLLKSYAIFKRRTGDHQSKLVLVRKGPDAGASQSLSQTLGINHDIAWTDEMRREELDRYYQGAAVCFGQFGTPVITYAALEPLANGTISISFSNDNGFPAPFYKEKPPIFSSRDPKEIAEFMVRVLARKEDYEDLSYESWLWIQNNCSEEKFVESFLTLFQET
jgi:glycosyltransferase involved in cell wall biosynthesis